MEKIVHTKIYELYNNSVITKKLIDDILTNSIDYMDYVFNMKNMCCRACTLKILEFYSLYKIPNNRITRLEAIFSILTSTYHDVYNGELKRKYIEYNPEIFKLFYQIDKSVFIEYTNHLDIMEILEMFELPLCNDVIPIFQHIIHRITENFICSSLIKMMENRTIDEHIIFCKFLRLYIKTRKLHLNTKKIFEKYYVLNNNIEEVRDIYKCIMDEEYFEI
ncbi:hypothetical protein TCON_2095 [Astathelohania contejeani]|uniref:Uncharacterized protein n=1 Tax=Astathelohania contejeani TaxID=164912 RepID=A0ABQ7HWZ5_9MICR|nr:hypothetical protein TCON_2095 [Thelohania contejeani]